MIATLMKHEWLRTRGLLGTIVAIALLLVAVGALLTATGWPVFSLLGLFMAVFSLGGLVPVLQIALTVHYWQSSYSRTGYFTQSLPLRGSTIYLAKLLWALLVSLAGIALIAGLLLAIWPVIAGQLGADGNPFAAFGQLWSSFAQVASVPTQVAAVALFLGMFLIWPVQYFFSASVGSETPLNRLGLGGPVLVFVGLYILTQVAVFVGMFALPWGIGMADGQLGVVRWALFEEMTVGASSTSDVMPMGFVPAMVLVTLACLARTVYSWNRKVSLV